MRTGETKGPQNRAELQSNDRGFGAGDDSTVFDAEVEMAADGGRPTAAAVDIVTSLKHEVQLQLVETNNSEIFLNQPALPFSMAPKVVLQPISDISHREHFCDQGGVLDGEPTFSAVRQTSMGWNNTTKSKSPHSVDLKLLQPNQFYLIDQCIRDGDDVEKDCQHCTCPSWHLHRKALDSISHWQHVSIDDGGGAGDSSNSTGRKRKSRKSPQRLASDGSIRQDNFIEFGKGITSSTSLAMDCSLAAYSTMQDGSQLENVRQNALPLADFHGLGRFTEPPNVLNLAAVPFSDLFSRFDAAMTSWDRVIWKELHIDSVNELVSVSAMPRDENESNGLQDGITRVYLGVDHKNRKVQRVRKGENEKVRDSSATHVCEFSNSRRKSPSLLPTPCSLDMNDCGVHPLSPTVEALLKVLPDCGVQQSGVCPVDEDEFQWGADKVETVKEGAVQESGGAVGPSIDGKGGVFEQGIYTLEPNMADRNLGEGFAENYNNRERARSALRGSTYSDELLGMRRNSDDGGKTDSVTGKRRKLSAMAAETRTAPRLSGGISNSNTLRRLSQTSLHEIFPTDHAFAHLHQPSAPHVGSLGCPPILSTAPYPYPHNPRELHSGKAGSLHPYPRPHHQEIPDRNFASQPQMINPRPSWCGEERQSQGLATAGTGSDDGEDTEQKKRVRLQEEKKRERNRQASKKSRIKKNDRIEHLEDLARKFEDRQTCLKIRAASLDAENGGLKQKEMELFRRIESLEGMIRDIHQTARENVMAKAK
ncbi:hypothetical protein HDU97_009406 [Phlyctochytrium planicorne]|nr:hypothetical protein HDU97_009406 [Phlyctochytrium planicorne]